MADIDPSAASYERRAGSDGQYSDEQLRYMISSQHVFLRVDDLVGARDHLTVRYTIDRDSGMSLEGGFMQERGVAYRYKRWYATQGRSEPIAVEIGVVVLECDFGYRIFAAALDEPNEDLDNCMEYKILDDGSVSRHPYGYHMYLQKNGVVNIVCIDDENEELWPDVWQEADNDQLDQYCELLKDIRWLLDEVAPEHRVKGYN